jgi:dolichol-phosphate mannosyltransferase
MSDFRLLDREALALVARYPDRYRNLRLLVSALPVKIHFMEYEVAPRMAGRSKYSLAKMMRLAADGLFAYSNAPLRLSLFLCGATALISMSFFVYAVIRYWRGETVWGWASLVCLMAGLFSGVFGVLAILCEYVARIYEDVRARPVYWVDRANSVGLE